MSDQSRSPLKSFGSLVLGLAADQAEWSQATFGRDSERGPVGALRHLELEAGEAWHAAVTLKGSQVNPGEQDTIPASKAALLVELADCQLLILDAARRSGFSPEELFKAAVAKMAVNKARTWPTPQDDAPVEHVKPITHNPIRGTGDGITTANNSEGI